MLMFELLHDVCLFQKLITYITAETIVLFARLNSDLSLLIKLVLERAQIHLTVRTAAN